MPKQLLVADKSVVIQKSVGITFAQEDFTVTYANDGDECLEKVKQLKPDVLLVHTGIPKKSGYDVCQAMKADPQMRGITVILMTGTHEAFDEARSKSAGADAYIIKPFESQALIDRVKELTSRTGAPAVAAQPPSPPQPAKAPATPPPQPPRPVAATPPAPPAAPRPQAPTPSPSATIAGPARPPAGQPFIPSPTPPPLPPKVATPTASPASTIMGQAPSYAPPISRDAPMLDLDLAAPEIAPEPEIPAADSVFDFSFDDAPSAAAVLEPQAEPTGALPSGDIWDFSAEVVTSAPAATPEPVADVPLESFTPDLVAGAGTAPEEAALELSPDSSFDASGGWLAAEEPGAAAVIASEPIVAPVFEFQENPPAPEVPAAGSGAAADFGFDLSESDATQVQIADGAASASPFDFSVESSVPSIVEPSFSPEAETAAYIPEPAFHESTSPIQQEAPASGNGNIALTDAQMEAIVSKVFAKVIERIAWEVVPDLAEALIKEELSRLTKSAS